MDQNKIKRMFGSKRAISMSEVPDSNAQHTNILIEADPKYKREALTKDQENVQKFYSEKELSQVQGSWDFKKSSPILEASLTDYSTQERFHTDQARHAQPNHGIATPDASNFPSKKPTMSLNDLKSQTGIYQDYPLSSHFDYSPAIERPEQPQHQDDFTSEEVPYNMSYLPEDTQALPGTKGHFLFTRLISRTMMVLIAILIIPLSGLAGLYALQGSEGEQWLSVKGHVSHLVRYAQGSEKTLFKVQPANIAQSAGTQNTASFKQQNRGRNPLSPSAQQRSNVRRFGAGGQVISNLGQTTNIPLMIDLKTSNLPSDIRVKISGLPNNASLTKGHYMTAGVWMVPIADIPDIAMQVSGVLKHDINLKASFLQADGQLVELASYIIPQNFQNEKFADAPFGNTKTATNNTAANKTRTRHMNLSSRESASTLPKIKNLSVKNSAKSILKDKLKSKPKNTPVRIHPVYEQQQLNRASIYLAKSDFKTARDILEKTANSGSARAATALARSYDPKFLLKIKVQGIKPDLKKAKYWYQQAVKLGNGSALNRLSQLK